MRCDAPATRLGSPRGHVDPSGEERRIERADVRPYLVRVCKQAGHVVAHREQGLLERAEPTTRLRTEPKTLRTRDGLGAHSPHRPEATED